MSKVYTDKDADLGVLKKIKTLAVLGFRLARPRRNAAQPQRKRPERPSRPL